MFVLFFASYDYQRQYELEESDRLNSMQNSLMKLFFADIKEGAFDACTLRPTGDFRYGSYGIISVDGLVTQVSYYLLTVGNFNIHALPNSTQLIAIEDCKQQYEVKTRLLPSSLVRLRLETNRLYGSVDLMTLPENLEDLSFENNRISGPIFLIKLPRSLRELNLMMNDIQQETIWYHNLPDRLLVVKLSPQRESNRIQEVRSVRSQEATRSTGIFRGMAKTQIH